MSYSYLTSVFPEFQSSDTFGTIFQTSIPTEKEQIKKSTGFDDNEMTKFAKNLLTENGENVYILPQTSILEEYSEVNFNKDIKDKVNDIKSNKNNLQFYNLPYVKQIEYKEYKDSKESPVKKIKSIEGYTDSNDDKCDEYMKHVLECSLCKSAITKQLQLDNDRIRNEEIMELISYIAFGIFVLLLIDNIKKK
jgi:hypothetical protein